MARADYRCPGCGTVVEHVYPMAVGAVASAPWHDPCQCYFEWIPFARFDLKGDGEGDRGFQKFTVHRQVPTKDGMVQVEETIDSLHKLRQIERDSEQRYRDGEGEPLRFRAYSQEPTNQDVGLFGPFIPEESKLKKSGRVTVKAITPPDAAEGGQPEVTTGPGMSGAVALAEER